MSYTIKSDNFELGTKKKGDLVTEKELLDAGYNADALVAGNHLSSSNLSKTVVEKGAEE